MFAGLAGVLLTVLLLIYTGRAWWHFTQAERGEIALLFPHQRVQYALYVLLTALLVFAAAMAAGAAAIIWSLPVLDTASQLGAGLSLLGLVYFMREIAVLTTDEEIEGLVAALLQAGKR